MEEEKYIKCDLEIFLDLMRQIDYLFELCVTDNAVTDHLFRNSANLIVPKVNFVRREERKEALWRHRMLSTFFEKTEKMVREMIKEGIAPDFVKQSLHLWDIEVQN
jgi:hypothetical protein